MTCYNPALDSNGGALADIIDSRGLFSNIHFHIRDIDPSTFSQQEGRRLDEEVDIEIHVYDR